MPDDLDLLQGTWSITAFEADGNRSPAEILSEARVTVNGDRFAASGMGAEYAGSIRLDASAAPRRIDMQFEAGPEKGNVNRGIYEIEGNTWRLCLATRGDARPTGFASSPGSGFALETLTRAKRPKATKPKAGTAKEAAPISRSLSAAPSTELEGEWRMLSGILNGQPLDASNLQWVRRVTQGNVTTVYAGPQVLMKMEFTADASGSPATIEYHHLSGTNKGKTQRGIYRLDGEMLTLCIADPGVDRPDEFAPGPDRTLTAWKRQ